MKDYAKPDLRQYPPRSPRVRLGGFVHLARLIDKARAKLGDALGEYRYENAFLDGHFFRFTGLDPATFLAEVAKGGNDYEILQWVRREMSPAREPFEVEAWSRWLEALAPRDDKMRHLIADKMSEYAPHRDDLSTFFEHVDADDYYAFGGKL